MLIQVAPSNILLNIVKAWIFLSASAVKYKQFKQFLFPLRILACYPDVVTFNENDDQFVHNDMLVVLCSISFKICVTIYVTITKNFFTICVMVIM